MKRSAVLTLAFNLIFPSSADASVRTIFATQAQGNGSIVTLEVSPGLGLNINLIPTGEVVKKVWLDDPSRIALGFDGELCQGASERQQECTNEGATVIHLRQIKPINFPHLPRSSSGTSLLTLVVEGAEGRKLYQFKVKPISGEAKYTSLTISPDPQTLTSIFEQIPNATSSNLRSQTAVPTRYLTENTHLTTSSEPTTPSQPVMAIAATKPQPTQAESPQDKEQSAPVATQSSSYSQQAINDIRAVRAGLTVAKNRQLINYGTPQWNQAQSAILWLSRGKSREEAALRAGLSLSQLNELIGLGQQSL